MAGFHLKAQKEERQHAFFLTPTVLSSFLYPYLRYATCYMVLYHVISFSYCGVIICITLCHFLTFLHIKTHKKRPARFQTSPG